MRIVEHQADFCVVGGGLAGICAAVAAARHGINTILMHDRPVLGGNASSEVRMWICGARGKNNLETGIIEEIRLENMYRNNNLNYSIWDSILYEKVRFQENLTLLLNCSCNNAEMDGSKIKSITGWQLTSETWHKVKASLFADCSGDSILAPLTGAQYRYGREAKNEFGESIQPHEADEMTMGMSCLIQARETDSPQTFIPPAWAYKYESDASMPNRDHQLEEQNFWWMEIGGEQDTVHDCEEIRDELLKIAFGVWDHIKNYGSHNAENWILEWVGFLPGKRESRRYVGDHIMTQNDVSSGSNFADIVAYGGWSMDDHHPAGFRYPGEPTIFHPAPSPYGIPLRCLYSKNIANLFFAGRNISTTHAAMSSTRVMATCALLGQAAGTAATVAVNNKLSPKDTCKYKTEEVQRLLQDDDCWLPGLKRKVSELTCQAELNASTGEPELLRNGIDRHDSDNSNCWTGKHGDWVEYILPSPELITRIRLVFDSNLSRDGRNMPSSYPLNRRSFGQPETLVRAFKLELQTQNQSWTEIFNTDNNYQRLVNLPVDVSASRIRLTILDEQAKNVFSFEIS